MQGAEEAIRKFNGSQTLLASDRLMHLHFKSVVESFESKTIAERIVLVDRVWATQLFRERGSADEIVTKLKKHSEMLIERVAELRKDALAENPEQVVTVAEEVFPVILRQVESNSQGRRSRQNYSFATKFFHWTTREHFPIVDRLARSRIHQIQKQNGVASTIRRNYYSAAGLSPVKEYPLWIRFYSELIRMLSPSQRESLLSWDNESQSWETRVENSLLRVLDKVFYIQGGGTGLGGSSP